MVKIKKIKKTKKIHLTFLQLIILLISLVIISSGLTMISYPLFVVHNFETFYTEVTVSDTLGLNTENNLDFGKMPPDSSGHKKINITHHYQEPLLLQVKIQGDKELKEWIEYPADMIIFPNKSNIVPFSVYIPQQAEKRTYSGETKLILRKI